MMRVYQASGAGAGGPAPNGADGMPGAAPAGAEGGDAEMNDLDWTITYWIAYNHIPLKIKFR